MQQFYKVKIYSFTFSIGYTMTLKQFNGLHKFLAHLSRRLRGELIVYRSSRPPCVCASVCVSVHTFKHEYLSNQLADWNEILSGASLGWGKGFSRVLFRFDQNSGFHGNR